MKTFNTAPISEDSPEKILATVDDTQRREHPVWCLYDEWRTARLNAKYYSVQIQRLIQYNFVIDIIAATSVSSAVAGFSFWQTAYGGYAWKALGVIATIISIAKPIIKLPDKIRKKQEALIGYSMLDYDFSKICIDIRFHKKYDEVLHQQFIKAIARKGDLMKVDADEVVDVQLRDQCARETIEEMPSSSFYIPQTN